MLAISVANCSKDGADGINGKDGINGINGVDGQNGKTILSGNGNPAGSLGTIGDFYLNLDNHTFFGPKTNSGWGSGVSLIGATGQNGQNGTNGQDGQNGADGKTILSGNGTPASNLGKNGDFYLNLDNHTLFGPKTDSGWGSGIALNGGENRLKDDYLLSKDGRTLLQWFDKEITTLDMEADPKLRNVTRIGKKVFEECELTTIVLPQGLISIGKSAFEGCKLTSVIIPNSVTSIGESAFSHNRLSSVTIPNSVTSIGASAFLRNDLTSVTIPDSVTIIEDNTFGGNLLSSVTIPSSVERIGEYAFSHNGLISVTIPSSVTGIGPGAFSHNRLSSVTIPNGVIGIATNAFAYNRLSSVTIPSSVVNVGSGIFSGNDLLTSVTIQATRPPIMAYNMFESNHSNLKNIYVPAESVDIYKRALSRYADKIKPIQ